MVTASMAGLMMPVSAMAVISGLRASGNAAGIMGMAAHVCAACNTAVMIPMTVISRVGIAVLAVMHVSRSFGTTRNAADAVAVFTGLCTAVNAAKSVCMRGFQSASRNAAVMIPMTVIRRVGIAVLAVVHMGGCFGTTRNAAGAVAVFTGQGTADNSTKAVLMYFCLCASQNRAGNIHLIFLCSTLDFRGTLIYRIGDNTACYHGNGYECNSR